MFFPQNIGGHASEMHKTAGKSCIWAYYHFYGFEKANVLKTVLEWNNNML
jgi:hypothetical protein